MGLDFSAFLLNYIPNAFLKRTDIVNLLISLTAIFVGMAAIIISLASVKLISVGVSSVIVIGAGIVIIGIPSLFIYYKKMKKNHKRVFTIVRSIIQNYNNINEGDDIIKNKILDQFQRVITEGLSEKEVKNLIDLLCPSTTDKPKATKCSRWHCKRWNGEEHD